MPYIPAADRPAYDSDIDRIAATLATKPPDQRKGHANYVITQILRQAWGVDKPEGESYSDYADVVGTLECAKLELYRRWIAAYEDLVIAKNGDL